MKKRVGVILLLVSFIAPLAGTFVMLQLEKKMVRKAVKTRMISGVEKEALVLLKFTQPQANKLRWKHAKEFEYNGNMYDVVTQSMHLDTLIYWCWPDDKETALNQKLDDLVAYALGNDTKRNETKEWINHFYKTLFFENDFNDKIGVTVLKSKHNAFICNDVVRYSSPPVPPPKCS